MLLYPKAYLNNILEIDYDFLNKNNIYGLILDVDNTLIDYYKNLIDGSKKWCNDLKQKEIKFCIVSNSNNEEKVKNVANELENPYIFLAKKPLKSGFIKAAKQMELQNENIAAVGDQIFTDVIGANRAKMFSILVKPIKERDLFVTMIKRPLEKLIINRYQKKQREENK